MSGVGRRLLYGPERQPLEPRVALPWLMRAVAWALVALGFLLLGTVASLTLADADEAAVLAALAGITVLFAGGTVRWFCIITQPAKLDRAPYDEEY